MKKQFLDTSYSKHLKRPEDFVVEEIIDPRFTRKFTTTGRKVERMQGSYALCTLRKRGRTTQDVLKEISKKLSLPERHIGYAGLKDKHAVTTQYLTLKDATKTAIRKITIRNSQLTYLQQTDKHISLGDLLGNRFRITLHKVRPRQPLRKHTSEVRPVKETLPPKTAEVRPESGLQKRLEKIKKEGFPNF